MNVAALGEILSEMPFRQQIREEGHQAQAIGLQLRARHTLLGLE
jgi:hypothetical protein